MSIADDFAIAYIDYMHTDDGDFNSFMINHYRPDDLYQIVILLYWKISNQYDVTHHRPITGEVMYALMNINLYRVIEYLHINDEPNDIASIINAIENDFEIIIDDVIKNELDDEYYFL